MFVLGISIVAKGELPVTEEGSGSGDEGIAIGGSVIAIAATTISIAGAT